MSDLRIVALTLAAAVALVVGGRGDAARAAWVEVTVVAPDAAQLACEGRVGELSCTGPRALQPFVTTSGRLVALPGLFDTPAVQAWEAPGRRPDERIRVRCQAEVVARAVPLEIRFSTRDRFARKTLDVADISACEVR